MENSYLGMRHRVVW